MKIIAVMPIKLNNERCPGKNTRLLGGKPLLQHELDTLMSTNLIDETYVYCSSPEIEVFLPRGVLFEQRPKYLDSNSSNFTQIFAEFIKKHDADIYVYAHATAPFISKETMIECITAVTSDKYDSAFCAEKLQDYLWRDGEPLNFDASAIPRTQDLKPIYKETSGIYVLKKEVFQKYRRRIGVNPFVFSVSAKESVDIDEPNDFRLAEILMDANI